ncbi:MULTISPECIES: hypothetical protein [Sphingobium]|uniref:Uncharacterized protein n=1 Tax=Sphingobium cupriresistens TaxID=1132417 RepID=A0A8G2DVE4_9SPHN|nr:MULTISPECIES: hypothetical protein [Sphingobium]MBJ7376701.1 hypothetical protein [Sphingobium sp.]RYM10177.1 hypothetical protein EWH12_12475 [Sphingobium cupriresistens]
MMLALVAGCRGSSADNAQADNRPSQPVATVASIEPEAAPLQPPVEPVIAPVKALPVVTVRAQPAPRNALDLPPSDDGGSALPFPQEVTSFMVGRDGCDHFRGEEPHDAERRAYIAENIAELCSGTDAKLAMLRRRYAGDRSVTAALRGYEDRIEGVSNY